MKSIYSLELGSNDAEDFKVRSMKKVLDKLFLKNHYLDQLLEPTKTFLIGEKGTGKTAYAVFLSNNEYKNTKSEISYLRETDYQKFVVMKDEKDLKFSSYVDIWQVILLLQISSTIQDKEVSELPFSRPNKFKCIKKAVEDYHNYAFSPEVRTILSFIYDSKIAASTVFKFLSLKGEEKNQLEFSETTFQTNLLYLKRKFIEAISDLKLKRNHILFIDGIDIRPDSILYRKYLNCIKGLAEAAWSLNNDIFPGIKDSKGRLKIVLLLRPDILDSLELQNTTNRVINNSVYLDWRTTYPSHRTSELFKLCDHILNHQQSEDHPLGHCWDHYFDWKSPATNESREFDPPFIDFLRYSFSRPRDLITIMLFLRQHMKDKNLEGKKFSKEVFQSDDFLNAYSEYLMGSLKDHLSFYYKKDDYKYFLKFFTFFEGRFEITYREYTNIYKKFIDYVLDDMSKKREGDELPAFIDTPDTFLQFLYDTNIVCYIEYINGEKYFNYCYRDRNSTNISPEVKPYCTYRIHHGFRKKLRVR